MTTDRELKDGWRLARFGEVVREAKIATKDPEADGLTRVVGLEHLDPESLPLRRWNEVSDLGDGTSFTRVFRAGQVLFGKRRAYLRKVAVADFDGICSSDILVLEPSVDDLLAEFLPYLVQSDGFFDHALGTSAGSLSPRTKFQELAKYEFLLPPVPEQRWIVDALGAADDVHIKLCRSAAAADSLLRGELRRLLDSSLNTPSQATGVIADVRVGKKLSPDKRLGVRPRPTLRAVNLRLDGLDLSDINEMDFTPAEDEALSIRAGDILLVEGGNRDSVGAPTWVTDTPASPLYIQNTIVRLRPKAGAVLQPRFLYWIWRAKFTGGHFESLAVGTKLYHLGPRRVAGVELPVPTQDAQEDWTERLDRVDALRRKLGRHLEATKHVRSRLLNDLLGDR